MRIAYFTDLFLPSVNGVVTSLLTISEALQASGNNILICAPRPASSKKFSWGDRRIKLELFASVPSFIYEDFRVSLPISPNMLKKVRAFNPDIVHFQTPFVVGEAGVILAKLLKKPVIGTFHGYFMEPEYLEIVNLQIASHILSNVLWKYAAIIFNQADAVLSPTVISKKDLTKHGVARPIFVIPNSIDTQKIKKTETSVLNQLKIKYKLKDKVVLYVGRISPEKSLNILIQSFRMVLKQEPNSSLFIIGDGPIRQSLILLVRELGIENNVAFAGVIPQKVLLREGYYQVADIFATASTSECQPVSIIEAMYFGLPLVGVSEKGTGEMIKNVGLLAKPRDIAGIAENILKILRSRHLKTQLADKSRRAFYNKYDLPKVISAYVNLYTNVMDNKL